MCMYVITTPLLEFHFVPFSDHRNVISVFFSQFLYVLIPHTHKEWSLVANWTVFSIVYYTNNLKYARFPSFGRVLIFFSLFSS